MKKLIAFLVLLGMGAFSCYAGEVGGNSMRAAEDNSLLGVDSESIYTVLASTVEAKVILDENDNRKGYLIVNQDNSNSIYKATYSATAAKLNSYQNTTGTNPVGGLYEIASDSEYEDSLECYTGNVYVIGVDTSTQIDVIEKY